MLMICANGIDELQDLVLSGSIQSSIFNSLEKGYEIFEYEEHLSEEQLFELFECDLDEEYLDYKALLNPKSEAARLLRKVILAVYERFSYEKAQSH